MNKHNYKCHICEKSFFNDNDLKSHLQKHQDEIKHAKPNIVTNISKRKKIKWRKNISCIKNIPFTKITIKGDTLQRIKEMFLIL